MAFYESILASPHRTLNGEEADFFFVPVLDSCIITRADDAPHLSLKVGMYNHLLQICLAYYCVVYVCVRLLNCYCIFCSNSLKRLRGSVVLLSATVLRSF